MLKAPQIPGHIKKIIDHYSRNLRNKVPGSVFNTGVVVQGKESEIIYLASTSKIAIDKAFMELLPDVDEVEIGAEVLRELIGRNPLHFREHPAYAEIISKLGLTEKDWDILFTKSKQH